MGPEQMLTICSAVAGAMLNTIFQCEQGVVWRLKYNGSRLTAAVKDPHGPTYVKCRTGDEARLYLSASVWAVLCNTSASIFLFFLALMSWPRLFPRRAKIIVIDFDEECIEQAYLAERATVKKLTF